MAYIPPNSTVQYFFDLGLSRDDTLFFDSVSSKNTYFAKLTKIASEESLTYVSREKGIIRSSLPMSTAINIGYMRYKNTSFENFWFYAYVTNVEYINNGLTEIHFEIDNMLTYMGVFTLGECFVERQHVLNDTIGANICDENLDTGEYIIESVDYTGFFTEYCIAIIYNPSESDEQSGGIKNGLYSGCAIEYYTDPANANAAIESFISSNKIDSILAVYMLPLHYVRKWEENTVTAELFAVNKPYDSIAGYKPKNKKLFCYPYKMLSVSNNEGQSNNYMYEFFNDVPDAESKGMCNFDIFGIANADPQVTAVPKFYKNANVLDNWDEKISMVHWAQCALSIDGYKAYLAQRNSTLLQEGAQTAISTGISAAASIAAGNPIGIGTSIASAANQIGNILTSNMVRIPSPAIGKGSTATDMMTACKKKDFYFIHKSITRNYAQMIDSYFDMFGYAVRQHLTPNMNARPNWTYCKTIGCIVHGNMPASAARDIESMFDNGIRFWKNHNNIGNYSLDNAPA